MSSIGQGSISIDDSTRIGENAQDTANEVAGNVNDINNDNKLTPSEKLKLKQEYDKDVELYNIDIEQLKSVDLPTAELETAMSNLTDFVTPLFKEMNRTSTVDRGALDSVFTAFATADKNASQAFVNMVQQVADGAKKAGSEAVVAGNQASEAASNAAAQAIVAVSNANVAQSSAAAAIAKAGFASDAASAASQTASNAASTANAAAAGVIDAKNDATNALANATSAINNAKSALSEAQSASEKYESLDMVKAWGNTSPQNQNMTNWIMSGSAKKAATITCINGVNTIDYTGVGNYEVFNMPISAKIGEKVSVTFSYTQPAVIGLDGTKNGIPVSFLETAPLNNKLGISPIYLGTDPQTDKVYTISTIATAETMYLSFNFGYLADNQHWQFKVSVQQDMSTTTPTDGTPGYVGFANKQSDNPADYTWLRNPDKLEGDIQQQFTNINGQLESKVSKDTYNMLADTVSKTSTLAQQNQSTLVSKADSSTVDLLNKRVATAENTLTQTATKTELEQTKTDVDDINKTVQKNTSDITAQAGKINGLLSTTQNVGDQLTTLSGQFNLSSQQLKTTMSKVDNLSIGGRNYALNTANTITVIGNNTVGQLLGDYPTSNDIAEISMGTKLTVSYDIDVTNADGGRSYFGWGGTHSWQTFIKAKTFVEGKNHVSLTFDLDTALPVGTVLHMTIDNSKATYSISNLMLEVSSLESGHSLAPEDQATVTTLTQVKQTAEGAQTLATNNHGDITDLQVTAKGLQTSVSNAATKDQLNILSDTFSNEISSATSAANSKMIQTINNAGIGFTNPDGSKFQMNLSADGVALMDFSKIMLNGTTNIANGTINTAQIADGAINNAKIANAAINDAKISNLNGNKIVAGSITANKINVNDLIANGINTKTLTSVNLNTSTLTTPKLNLGMNGTFTEDFDYTQPTSLFLPKKNKGTLTFNHGVLQSRGRMQTYTGGQWGGMNDNYTVQAGIDNAQWTEVAPGYIKLDLFKQNNADVGLRTYIDPTGYYYTSRNGIASYLGNILQVSQVQTPSVLAKYIGPSDGELRLQIGNNGSHYGFQVGSYAGKEAVLSDFIYSATSSHSPDVHITENGHLVRTTSASKYKYNIENPDIETTLGDRLLNVRLATWNDKRAVDSYAEQLSTGEEREKTSIDKYYGLIAEQLRDAGLDMFISYGKNHEIEGIQYDRAWIPLLSVIRRLNNKVNEYELRISKLEGKIDERFSNN